MLKYRPTALVAFVTALVLLPSACKRDADAPLPKDELFPSTTQRARRDNANPFGTLHRARTVAESEPNDGPERAQPVADHTIVQATLGPSGGVPGATDFFAVQEGISSGRSLTLALRKAPDCAVLAVLDGGGKTVVSATVRDGDATLDHLQPGEVRHVRVRCESSEKRGRQPTGGPYELHIASRPAMEHEEREPNDTPNQRVLPLPPQGAGHGTLGRTGDIDLWSVSAEALGRESASSLSLTGLVGVALELQARAADGTVVFRRTAGPGTPIVVPNFHVALLGQTGHIAVIAKRGATSADAYALALSAPAASGAVSVTEREPSDSRIHANLVMLDKPATGLLDGRGDVDWWALDVVPGTALGVFVTLPDSVRARLVVHPGGGKPVWATAVSEGASLKLERVPALAERIYVRVHGVGASADPRSPYTLEVTDMSALDAALDLSNVATADLAPTPTPVAAPPGEGAETP